MRQYPGSSTKGDRRIVPVWEYYDQLTIKNQGNHYRRVNDAFFDVWKCIFDKGLYKRRISEAAYSRVSQFGCVFLQFPTFTYIWIGCFSGEPFILPRFPSDKIILIESCRQLISVHEKQSQAHKTGLKFPESIGRHSMLTNPKAKNMEEEMQWNTMRRFKARTDFDFWGIKNKLKRTYTHVYRFEDVWADYQDEEVIRRMDFSRLTLDQIENLDLAKIPLTMEDIDAIVDPIYYEKKIADSPLPLVQWSKKERRSISQRISPIIANSNAWLLKKNLRMKQFPTSLGDDDNSDGPLGKTTTTETRTKNRANSQALSSAPVVQLKGKGPKIKFTVKGSKQGESSLVS